MVGLMLAGTLLVCCTAATGKGHDYVVFTARRGSTLFKVQVTLPIDKVCVGSFDGTTNIRLVHEGSGSELLAFNDRSGPCQKPGDEVLQEEFANGTDYTLVADLTKGRTLSLPLLDRDPLTGQDL
jgi:hypothetical protein